MKKNEFFIKEDNCFFFEQPMEIAEYCKKHWSEEVAHILRVADEVCNRYFLFDLKWDMERTYQPVIFEDKIDWSIMPADDKEFIFQFNRHRFFICLGQAYQLTGDEKYAKAFTELLMDWITNVPMTKESKETTWRILEVGIRGENWTKAIRYFKDSPYLTDEVIDAFYHSLLQHAEYIVEMHSTYRLISNWGVIENHGLFEIAMALPPSERSAEYVRLAIARLDTLIRMGIMNDGVQWEQSPMYHNEVLHCYLDVYILASRNGIKLPDTMLDKIRRMAYADASWKKPNHHQIMMGDSDDTDIRDIITVAAYVFRDPVLKFSGYDILDFESIWDLGLQAAIEYSAMEKKEPPFVSVGLMDSGNYYLRSNWQENANLLHFHCGTLGAGHGHSDKLHIDLVIQGEDVLMDAGRFNYVTGPERFEFKDPMAHNTMTVDGALFTVCKDSWECYKLSQPVKQQFVTGDQYDFVQGGHLGYMDLKNGVFHNRKIIYIKPDIYIIVDEMYTGGEHEYNQYFHFNNMGSVVLEGNQVTYSGEHS
ncbi:MAG: heparinase II/III family protein, partial [Mobilitalea sp.]